jgi:hypothetical protein
MQHRGSTDHAPHHQPTHASDLAFAQTGHATSAPVPGGANSAPSWRCSIGTVSVSRRPQPHSEKGVT